jgi:hypothetical protein
MSKLAEKQVDETLTVALEFAEVKLSLAQMIDDQWLEVHRILGSQRARLLGGLVEEPDDSEIERAARGLARLRFLENCRDQPDKAIEWLRGRRNG